MSEERTSLTHNTTKDLVVDFLRYNRKEDEDLPARAIDKAIKISIALKEKIIRNLIPKDVSDEDGLKILVENGLRFCTYPDTPMGVTHVEYCGSRIGDIVETISETEIKVVYIASAVEGARNPG